ncbi:MAG: hypothetical protein EAX90_04440 [Candidatus Heimdallarchaeota archaeon]|nr:hypothetical protein [Candidatus Heimdallarchaeota archaeon]
MWLPLLLADKSANLRYLVLRELFGLKDNDEEIKELASLRMEDSLLTDLQHLQYTDGSWEKGDFVGGAHSTKLFATAQALTRLGYLGFGKEFPAVKKGAEYLFTLQNEDGSWPLPKSREIQLEKGGYEKMTLQTAIPLRGLAMCGYSTDNRAEKAYDWILKQRMTDGAWPTGYVKGNFGYVAGYRKIAHSRWGCRSNTTGALICLALHPKYVKSEEAKKALDLLLGRETYEQYTFGFEVARTIGVEQATGFITYFARYDLSLMLKLCWKIGASLDDMRVKELSDFIKKLQGKFGLWEYSPKPQASRWVTFDLIRSLSNLDTQGEWINFEPRTPFQTYPKKLKRF